jgi:sulfite reductase beta subunit-like hemoprotein/NADPH-dependent glutamate synthase beta subunit-like oxidoreductase/ferredoxin
MQFKMEFQRRSEEEYVKDQGLVIDYDEIARKGKMSKEEALISKWYGVYQSRQQGNHMARIVVPGGKITSAQARTIADASDSYSQGLLSITTRQAIQLHFLQVGVLPDMMRDIAPAGLSTLHGCGDVTRTIAACPLAESCSFRRIDVLPHAVATMKYLTSCRDLDNLPRKLKINFSGCPANCAQPLMNCIGVTAVTRDNQGNPENGFRITIGGGMGWKAYVGQELFGFVPEEAIRDYCRAIALLYRDNGDRFNRTTSRLKVVVARLGIPRCREIVLENLQKEGKEFTNNVAGAVPDIGVPYPPRPLTQEDPVGTDGLVTVRIIVPKGELASTALRRMAELSEIYANQRIYTDNRQNLSLHGVAPDQVITLKEEIHGLGFSTEGFFGLTDMVSCVGTTYCPKAVTTTRSLFDLLLPIVTASKYQTIRDRGIINITGCPNSCSPYRIADIGFRGERIREESGSVEGYELLLGGDEQEHGQKLGVFKATDCPELVERFLDLFLAQGLNLETIREFVKRVGLEYLKTECHVTQYQYQKAVAPVELSVTTGYGTRPSDFAAHERSVPCQSGCPVTTDIPGYIEKIAQGKFAEAYRINLENNVLPGVLGRICVRPCQTQCRHTWSDINGTVEICHLKRSAADRGVGAQSPLAPWFPESGKRVAVIGGGPAGVAAARELRRYGHDVTILEKEPQLGGMLVDGIPRFRLPLSVIREELELITSSGIQVKTGISVNRTSLEEIVAEYQAVVLATGTVNPNLVPITGLTPELAITGLEFMKSYNHGALAGLDGDVVIIGGGFTAVDSARACARTARKLLGENGNVTIVYRRNEEHLAADLAELEELAQERISVRTLLSPVSAQLTGGKLESIRLRKNYLGKGNSQGKPEIIPVEGSDFDLNCRHLILAIGQQQEWSILPEGVTLTEQFGTTHPKLFTAGDFRSGSLDVIHAIADGKEVASVIDTFLMGESRRKKRILVEPGHDNGETGRFRQHDLQNSTPMRSLELLRRIPADPEVSLGFDDHETQVHATRCYLCHHTFEIDQDLCIHCTWCVDVSPRNCIHQVSHFDTDEKGVIQRAHRAESAADATFIWIDSKNCIRCGKCLRVCPTRAISMKKSSLVNCTLP